jgi:hypothetical protein
MVPRPPIAACAALAESISGASAIRVECRFVI